MRAGRIWTVLISAGLGLVLFLPLIAAVGSPLLAYRQPVYIAAGLAGVLGLMLLALQPLLAVGALPGISILRGRRWHRLAGGALVLAVVAHVAGLWITSPPDVIDVLLLRSPTPFSIWGVMAMWAVFASAALALWRHRLRLAVWRVVHRGLALVITAGTAVHAALIEGTMEPLTKGALCILAVGATLAAMAARNSAR
ncbi:ferric reductase-like transmembrane domain-containing protein [Marinovum sp.]|uniref:ferric reductase-like transmembrane domain-containing protein n=1 Tax=Marinovum sp. TaxID=2024839 RepID=UPI002B275964|nr:ferric reductase-like transmembrane domain-containing protein [Marinovum sp.]